MKYQSFLSGKTHIGTYDGFDPVFMPDFLFGFQHDLVEWAVKKGRGAIFADCGLGKTPMQLVWAQNVVEKTNGKVLIVTPLAVGAQTKRESEKFGIETQRSQDGITNATSKIVITNYERLHYFNSNDYVGVVCDESSILKNFDGRTRVMVTDFMRTIKYRLLCTATAAPNDYIEIGTSSEAVGDMGYADMLSKFFKKTEKTFTRRQENKHGLYRFRGHSEEFFWRWMCSWARAIRKPSDLGHDDDQYDLPPLVVNQHIIKTTTPRSGMLFDLPAVTLQEQREERRRTINERCEKAAEMITNQSGPAVAWCHLNDEGDTLEKMIPDSVQVSGSDSDEHKEESFIGFQQGRIKTLITKPKIGGFGLNWEHCSFQTFFPSHSFEQWYQSIRRSWRFGQKSQVNIEIITSEGEAYVLSNLNRKAKAADQMFENLVNMMNNELKIVPKNNFTKEEDIPSWL